MYISEETKTIVQEYSCDLKTRFDENDGKIFLVDYSKSCAIKALSVLLDTKDFDSLFCVVEDKEMALEFADALKSIIGEVKIIDSIEALLKELPSSDYAEHELNTYAKSFKKKNPLLIITAQDENGKAILHRQLCTNDSKCATYANAEKKTPYCFSDLIAESRYDVVIIDNIYGLFAFEEGKSADEYDPAIFERVEFLGKAYYSDVNHSYKRLKTLIGGAKKGVLLSDVIVDKNVVNLYSALELLNVDFSLLKAREFIQSLSQGRYVELCERLCMDVSYCREDANILSICLQKLKSAKQRVPSDIDTMTEYLRDGFRFMSEEEIFLRAVYSHIQTRFNGKAIEIDTVLDMLENGSSEMANCFCNIFFNDTIKGELEESLFATHVCKMSESEMASLISVFLKYGAIHYYTQKSDDCKIMRFMRDDNGFEHFVRGYENTDMTDEYTYSILNAGSDMLYKCVQIQRLVDGRAEGEKCDFPLLIVSNKDLSKIEQMLKKFMPDYQYTTDLHSIAKDSKDKKIIVLTDYGNLRRTALWLHIHSIVFFDIAPDVVRLKALINKGIRYGNVKAYLLASYDDMSGKLVDAWQEELNASINVMPIDNAEMMLKEGVWDKYDDIIKEIDCVYGLLNDTVTHGHKQNAKTIAQCYNRMLNDFTLQVTAQAKEIERDIRYLGAAGKNFDEIFKNTSSVGDCGEFVHAEKIVFVVQKKENGKKKKKREKNRKTVTERIESEDSQRIFFNVCAKMLRGNCDTLIQNCAGCEGYKKFKQNDFSVFKKNLQDFFEKTINYAETFDSERLAESIGDIIHRQDDSAQNEGKLLKTEIEEQQLLALNALNEISFGEKKKGIFSVDTQIVERIRTAVEKTYTKLLRKYYETVMEIFKEATNKAKSGYNKVLKGLEAANNGL